jgi:hypothetical protein
VGTGALFGDLHEFDLEEYLWRDRAAELRGSAPAGREGHGMAVAGGRVYIFGGWQGPGYLSAQNTNQHSFDQFHQQTSANAV